MCVIGADTSDLLSFTFLKIQVTCFSFHFWT